MKAKKGLEGVIADESAISRVIPERNILIYRGYSAEKLSSQRSFLEVVYLLWKSELPTSEELSVFLEKEKQARKVDPRILNMLKECAEAHPMDALRTAVSMAGALETSPWDTTSEDVENKALFLLANIPVWIAIYNRLHQGKSLIEPDPKKSFIENFFYMCFGEVPDKKVLSAFEASLVLYADHGFNASTFTARVITSTTSDIYSAVSGAIGSLKGPLHGGANEQVMYMMKEIGEPDKARQWLLKALKERRKIMGFGHRVYKKGDARVPQMFHCAEVMAQITNNSKWIEMYHILKNTMLEEKNIHPNLDFPAGPAYYMMGFDIKLFTPLFVMSRVSGWSAHIMEQKQSNRIIRPLSEYTGLPEREIPLT